MSIPVRELKNHLSEYLRRVERGEEIVVVRRNTPVAKIVPMALAEMGGLEGVSWNGRQAKGGKHRPVVQGKSLADRVLEDRR
jgi:prevent-host-death family protein